MIVHASSYDNSLKLSSDYFTVKTAIKKDQTYETTWVANKQPKYFYLFAFVQLVLIYFIALFLFRSSSLVIVGVAALIFLGIPIVYIMNIKKGYTAKVHAVEHMICDACSDFDDDNIRLLTEDDIRKCRRISEGCGINFFLYVYLILGILGVVNTTIHISWWISCLILIGALVFAYQGSSFYWWIMIPILKLGSIIQDKFTTEEPEDWIIQMGLVTVNKLIELEMDRMKNESAQKADERVPVSESLENSLQQMQEIRNGGIGKTWIELKKEKNEDIESLRSAKDRLKTMVSENMINDDELFDKYGITSDELERFEDIVESELKNEE